MTIYRLLDKLQKKRISFNKTEDSRFFNENKAILLKAGKLSSLANKHDDDFDIIRANVVIMSMLNKQLIEKEIINFKGYAVRGEEIDHEKLLLVLKERMVDEPYYHEPNKGRIYLPIFSHAINNLYFEEPEKLLVPPYSDLFTTYQNSIIDPFDTYGANLYNSRFSRLVKIAEKDGEIAYFYYDTNTLYFINPQGRLDNKLVLFDKFLFRPNYNHMLERVTPVAKAYFDGDRQALINALIDNKLVSYRVISLLKKK